MTKGREEAISKEHFGVKAPAYNNRFAEMREGVFMRTPYNYDRDAVSDATGLKCEDESRTKQSFVEEADINTIVKRFHLTGELPTNVRQPTYGDFTEVTDFQTAMNAIRMATESFMAMPADVRARFHNDPDEFVAFCSDEKNGKEAAELGLIDKHEWDRVQNELRKAAIKSAKEEAAKEEAAAKIAPAKA